MIEPKEYAIKYLQAYENFATLLDIWQNLRNFCAINPLRVRVYLLRVNKR